jgi:uncharacterized membrane protein YkvA (DUF1232 family)
MTRRYSADLAMVYRADFIAGAFVGYPDDVTVCPAIIAAVAAHYSVRSGDSQRAPTQETSRASQRIVTSLPTT